MVVCAEIGTHAPGRRRMVKGSRQFPMLASLSGICLLRNRLRLTLNEGVAVQPSSFPCRDSSPPPAVGNASISQRQGAILRVPPITMCRLTAVLRVSMRRRVAVIGLVGMWLPSRGVVSVGSFLSDQFPIAPCSASPARLSSAHAVSASQALIWVCRMCYDDIPHVILP